MTDRQQTPASPEVPEDRSQDAPAVRTSPFRRPEDEHAPDPVESVDTEHSLTPDEALERSLPMVDHQVDLGAGASQRVDTELSTRTAERIEATPDVESKGSGSKLRLYVRRYLRNVSAVVGLVIFAVIALFGIFGGMFATHNYSDVDFFNLQTPPDANHWFGTNGAGQDVFAQLAHGIQRSLVIGLVVSLATTLIAAVVGSLAAYIGGIAERVILELIHFLLVVPNFLILALVSQSVGGDWKMLIVVLVIFGWMFYARVVWTMALSLREREYVAAARYMGLGPLAVVWRHIIPNIGSLLTIHFTLGVVSTIQSETALSFLGFGVKQPDTSLGAMIGDGIGTLFSAPWMFWFPAGTLVLLTVSMAFVADGLRDALDPNSAAGGRA